MDVQTHCYLDSEAKPEPSGMAQTCSRTGSPEIWFGNLWDLSWKWRDSGACGTAHHTHPGCSVDQLAAVGLFLEQVGLCDSSSIEAWGGAS